MPTDAVTILIDGRPCEVAAGASVIAALVLANSWCTRASVSGEPRFAVCGIGQCQECRVTIDGNAHRLACQTLVADGMRIITGSVP